MSAAAAEIPLRGGPGRPPTGARERILEAAISVLKDDGFAGLTTAKVARRAGESKALIAYHYDSKQGLVAAAGREIAERITERVLEGIRDAATVAEVIDGVIGGVKRLTDQDPRLVRIYFDLAAVSVVEPEAKETIRKINESWRGVLADLLTGAADGTGADIDCVIALLIAAAQGLALEQLESGEVPELDRAREMFVRMLVAEASAPAAIGSG